MVVEIKSVEEFDEKVMKGSGVIVVDFWATWCKPCVRFAPKFKKMDEEMVSITFYKLDVDELAEVMESQGINCMPTFKIYKNGGCVGTLEGSNEANLRELLNSHQ